MAGLSPASDLDQLAVLPRDLLHVFVAGPGYGEGIAVALPGRGWLVVDGCQVVDERLPLLEVLERWRTTDDPVDCVVMTHPHRDHAYGIRRVIERTNPRKVALSAPPDAPELAFGAADPGGAATTAGRTQRGTVVDAMLALQRRFEASPADFVPLVDGEVIPTSSAEVAVRACSPQREHARRVLSAARRPGGVDRPNELSAVLELNFGASRIVLGSDLLTAGPGGWNHVMSTRATLGQHIGLKVPHHGSSTAFHAALTAAGQGRAWWITPFSCAHLPSLEPDGIARLVDLNRRVLLTATPRGRHDQPVFTPPAEIDLTQLRDVFVPGTPAGSDAIASSPPAVEPLDAVWCVSFDRDARIRSAWRGNRAFAVVPSQ